MASFNDHPQRPVRSRPRSLFFPVLLIALGGYALAQRAGWVTLSLEDLLSSVWPLLLIGAGLNLIFGRVRPLVGAFLALLLIGSIATYQLTGLGFASRPVVLQPFSASRDDVRAARIELDGTGSDIRFSALPPDSALLISGSFASSRAELEQSIAVEEDDQSAEIELGSRGQGWFSFGEDSSEWDVQVAPKVVLDLDLGLSAVASEINLQELNVAEAKINLIAGDGTLVMPSAAALDKTATITLDVNATVLTIIIPPGTEARITTTSSASNVDIPERFAAKGNVFISPGWEKAEGRLDIVIEAAAASITIE